MDGLLVVVAVVDIMWMLDLVEQVVVVLVDHHQQQAFLELPILVVEEVVDSTLVLQLVVMVDLVLLLFDIQIDK
tara:strand:+ start:105 stop:326 length:222 start_codon:yes stop_codon:yes gene_type:complete